MTRLVFCALLNIWKLDLYFLLEATSISVVRQVDWSAIIRSTTMGLNHRVGHTKALRVKCDPGDMKTRRPSGGEGQKPRGMQSRMEETERAERCQAVRAKMLLLRYRPTPPEINTQLSSAG